MDSEKKGMAGTHFEMGNWACAEGAIAAGCGFFSGYPITPASEIANRLAQRIPETGGVFLRQRTRSAPFAPQSARPGQGTKP